MVWAQPTQNSIDDDEVEYDDHEPLDDPNYRPTVQLPMMVIKAVTGRAKCQLCRKVIHKGACKLSYDELDLYQVRGFMMASRSICRECAILILSEMIEELKGEEDKKPKEHLWAGQRKQLK